MKRIITFTVLVLTMSFSGSAYAISTSTAQTSKTSPLEDCLLMVFNSCCREAGGSLNGQTGRCDGGNTHNYNQCIQNSIGMCHELLPSAPTSH